MENTETEMDTMSSGFLRYPIGHPSRSAKLLLCGALLIDVWGSRGIAQTSTVPKVSDAAQATSPPTVPVQPSPLLLAGGDLLDIQVFNTPELSERSRVDQYGMLNLAVGGSIDVKGLTAAQLGHVIEDHLKASKIMRDPHVKVFVTEYATQGVTVLGEVKKPGPIPLYGTRSLYDILSAAGGVTQNAGSTITISHRNASTPKVIQVHSANFSEVQQATQINSGDTIVVSQADAVYVVGDVQHQGSFPILNGVPLTVLNVLSLSSGLTPTASGSKATIVRQNSTGDITTIPLNLYKILKQKDPNITMQAADILVVPSSTSKTLVQLALPSVTNSLTSAAVTAAIVRR